MRPDKWNSCPPKQAVNYYYDDLNMTDVGDTYFMGYHTPLKKSFEWYESLRAARTIADKITKMINTKLPKQKEEVKLFPYR